MLLYNFEGNVYSDHEDGRQALMEAIVEAIEAEAYADAEVTTEDQYQEAVSMSLENSYAATFWDGLMVIMQQCPYELNIRKLEVTVEPSGGEELTKIEELQVAVLIEQKDI